MSKNMTQLPHTKEVLLFQKDTDDQVAKAELVTEHNLSFITANHIICLPLLIILFAFLCHFSFAQE